MSAEVVTLESIGIDSIEMDRFMTSLKTGFGDEDRQICLCGHQMSRHERSDSIVYCSVSRAWCDCSHPVPVLEPEQVNPFRFATTGFGKKHALAKGVYALHKNGKTAKWLIEIHCFKCKAMDQAIYPAPINKSNKVSNSSGYRNVFLCMPCIEEIGVVYYY
jgi:hypothetical protein